jgi:hypothetical protein
MPKPSALGRIAACLGAILLLAACSAIPNPLVTPAPPDALHPRPAAVATPTPTPNPVKVTELDRQRAIWAQSGILSYRIRLIYGCQCPLAGKFVDVTVRRGAIADASMDGKALPVESLVGFPATVDQLFDYADRNAGAGKIELKYDDRLGYPTALGVDPDLDARDDEIRIAVVELAPGR